MKIYSRLMLSFLIVIALALILGIFGMVMVNMASAKAGEMYDYHVIGMQNLSIAQSNYAQMRASINRACYEAARPGDYSGEINAQRTLFNDSEKGMIALTLSKLEDISKKAHDIARFTYAPLPELKMLT